MRLKDCKMGILVQTSDLRVGHIVGLTYNIDISLTGSMTNEEKLKRTIPLVQFPNNVLPICHQNIEIFKG